MTFDMFKYVKLGKKLGEGAYGEVYQGLSTKDHEFIVIKKIPVPKQLSKEIFGCLLHQLFWKNIKKY